MSISKPCPKCQHPLDIPEPIPEKIQCPKCGVVIKYKVAEAPKPAIPAKIPTAPEPIKKSALPVEPARSGGVLSFLHTIIPKPILFGFYGALGGLLGVLLLGELFWLVLHPAPVVIEPLIVAIPPELTVFPGSQNKLTVMIERQGFEGPVRLEVLDLPEEIQIPEVTIAADEKKAELPVTTTMLAAEGGQRVKVRASSPGNEKVNVAETVQLWVRPTPPTLKLTVSPIVTVYAGGQNRFGFLVARKLVEGPVRVEVLDLPKGVQIPLVAVPEKGDKGEMSVSVTKDAKLGPQILEVEVHALENYKIASRETFQLNVLPAPGKLQLAASPQVTVYPGTKNKFSVKISRQEFTGPIEIEVTGGPRSVQFSKEIIPADKTETEIEVFAAQDIQPGGPPAKNLRVTAKALIRGEDITASVPLQLNIDAPPPAVQLAVSPKVPVYPGGKATFGVKISRARFQGPVQVDVQGADPNLVTISSLTIPANQTEGEMKVTVSPAALKLPLKHIMPVQVTARRKDGAGISVTEKVEVEILAPPSDLQLTISPEVEVYQAGKCSFTVKVARTGFLGPVQVTFNKVPAGVTFAPGAINADTIVLKGHATINAEPKKHEIEVTGVGPKAPDGKIPTTTQKFALTVKPFDPSIRPPLDIVFVLDVTQSLDPQIAGLRDGIGQFVKGLKDKELEARIGLVGFRDIIYDEVPFERLKVKGELFTTDTKAFATEVGKLKAMGGGDDPESSLDGIVEATKYPFRPKALKVLLLITDEKPQTKGNSVTMAIAQKALRDKKIDQVHLIIKKADMPNYKGLQDVAKGGFFDFEQASKKGKGNEGFASLLPLLSREIATTIGAPEPMAKPPALPDSALPPEAPAGEKTPEPRAEASPSSPRPVAPQPPKAGEASIIKAADPRPPEAAEVSPPKADVPSLKGMQSTAVYADEKRTQLMIANALLTAALAGGISLMLVGAQKRYLRQAWLSIGEIAKALLAGLAVGALAGMIGQGFFQYTSGSAWWVAISQVIAWGILGGLIGAGMGFFVPNMQWKRAVLGGCLGGLIGGVGFVLVTLLAHSFLQRFIGDAAVDILGHLIGAALVGLFIGFMVALAEIASRRYWLEVAFGEREVRTVTLGAATVALGGDEKLAGVYVPNAAPKALGFRVDKNRVFCEDFITGKTTEASPGDQRTLAGAKVKVCSAANAVPTGASLQLVVARAVPLMIGMPLTADDIPGLEAQGADGVVALVSRRPNNPKVFLLRNRSKQTWVVTEADGKERKVEPGLSIELSSRCEIDFGQVKATLDPAQNTEPRP
jgi:MFS family permease